MTDEGVLRKCDGCGESDYEPRAFYVVDMNNANLDVLFHYHCIPAELLEAHKAVLESAHLLEA